MKLKAKLKKLKTKVKKTHKYICSFLVTTCKNYVTMKKKIKALWLVSFAVLLCSCGSTRVSVDRPQQGTSTTITVTTNNPVTTTIDADANADLNTK